MLDEQKFPPSSIAALNEDMHQAPYATTSVQWSLVADGDRFHVFLVAECGPPLSCAIRIDWRAANRLEFEPYVADKRDERIAVGRKQQAFCRRCAIAKLRLLMAHRDYNLFAFNCRTVSYYLLVDYAEFDNNSVLDLFEAHELRCGVGSLEDCLSLEELEHYFRHVKSEQGTVTSGS